MATSNGSNTNTGTSITTATTTTTVKKVSKAEKSIGTPVISIGFVIQSIFGTLLCQLLYKICNEAYTIRLYAVREYGRVIHEFDPYFNYRATEYLYEHGWYKFRTWFDYLVWYPLGRPVGTTIYPGMQVTSVWIKNYILKDWSINDICVFVPAWFGVSATLSVALLTFICTYNDTTFTTVLNDIPILKQIYNHIIVPINNFAFTTLYKVSGTTFGLQRPCQLRSLSVLSSSSSSSSSAAASISVPAENNWLAAFCCAVSAAGIMSIVPAHLLRSIGGGYDNESIAMTAMVLVFATWTLTLYKRANHAITIVLGCITGIAYFYMVAAWGGYVFVLNLVGVHATFLVLIGRYSKQLYYSYTSFFIIGTTCATYVPVVGYTPLKSLEQIGPLLAFCCFQLIELSEILIRQKRASITDSNKKKFTILQAWILRASVFGSVALVGAIVSYLLVQRGYFGPISSRVRGLFVKHTKTGNPLVDSVAEHQAASPEAYKQYLDCVVSLVPIGFVGTTLFYWNDCSSFLFVYSIAAYFFSHKMVRLILLTAPIAATLGGIVIGRILAWGISGFLEFIDNGFKLFSSSSSSSSSTTSTTTIDKKKSTKSKTDTTSGGVVTTTAHPMIATVVGLGRVGIVLYLMYFSKPYYEKFYSIAHQMAQAISHPTIIMKARTQQGQEVLVDDYREAYLWLKKNTPEDARIMAWWDYGYQITGIGNRTTLADGNTWNHEHIALLGRTLTAPEREAHRVARHLADYVLIWAGGGGDDVAKSPHLRRIANSVYRGLCSEPTCRDFGFYDDHTPTASMRASLLFVLHSHGMYEGVYADPNRFREVFSSKYGKVRIFKVQSVSQESKEWVANPANRVCDAQGSWFCPGQYPPALEKILASKKDFQQLEDFNKGLGEDEEYQKQYFANLQGGGSGGAGASGVKPLKRIDGNKKKSKKRKLSDADIELMNEQWENSEATTTMWRLIRAKKYDEVKNFLNDQPQLAHIRSGDGRGPMWWAYESKDKRMIKLLRTFKVSETRTDSFGMLPKDVDKPQ